MKMRRCEDEKVRYRPPLLEEPCAQTLSGKNCRSRRRFENENASAPHSDLLLISFLLPVIALSGVKSKAGRGSS